MVITNSQQKKWSLTVRKLANAEYYTTLLSYTQSILNNRAIYRIWRPVCETQMEARGEAGTVRRGGAGTAQQAGDGAAGSATTGDGTSTLARMGVRRRTRSDAVTVSIFTSIG